MKETMILTAPPVRLRPIGPEDADAMYRSLDDPEGDRLTGTRARFTAAEVAAHCARVAVAEDRHDWGIEVDGWLVGEAVLFDIDRANRLAWFRTVIWQPGDRGHGHGQRALGLVLDHAFGALGLNRVELEVYAFNPRARHIYEKAGFQVEGVRRQALWWDGTPVDVILMGVLAADRPDNPPANR